MADRDAILTMLKLCHQGGIVAIEPATDDDLLDIEEAILTPIRGEFRDFLLSASHFIIGNLEPAIANDTQARNYLPELASQAWGQGIEREYLAFCEADAGYYCLTMDDQVAFIEPGDESPCEPQWDSIWAWAKDIWLKS